MRRPCCRHERSSDRRESCNGFPSRDLRVTHEADSLNQARRSDRSWRSRRRSYGLLDPSEPVEDRLQRRVGVCFVDEPVTVAEDAVLRQADDLAAASASLSISTIGGLAGANADVSATTAAIGSPPSAGNVIVPPRALFTSSGERTAGS